MCYATTILRLSETKCWCKAVTGWEELLSVAGWVVVVDVAHFTRNQWSTPKCLGKE
jgi:hypothetical protein